MFPFGHKLRRQPQTPAPANPLKAWFPCSRPDDTKGLSGRKADTLRHGGTAAHRRDHGPDATSGGRIALHLLSGAAGAVFIQSIVARVAAAA
jgi:hypothetical protein